MSAIQAIRSISNWLYWQSPSASGSSSTPDKSMMRIAYKLPEPDIGKLRDAAARKKVRDSKRSNHQTPPNCIHPEEYWAPSTYALPSSTTSTATPPTPAEKPPVTTGKKETNERGPETYEYENQNSPIRWGFPMVTALIAVATVRLHEVQSIPELKQHVGGSLALEIVNSSWLQCILAAATWYMIGMAIIELVVIIGNRNR